MSEKKRRRVVYRRLADHSISETTRASKVGAIAIYMIYFSFFELLTNIHVEQETLLKLPNNFFYLKNNTKILVTAQTFVEQLLKSQKIIFAHTI